MLDPLYDGPIILGCFTPRKAGDRVVNSPTYDYNGEVHTVSFLVLKEVTKEDWLLQMDPEYRSAIKMGDELFSRYTHFYAVQMD